MKSIIVGLTHLRAIELSLQESHNSEVITLSDDDEDEDEARYQEDLKKALQASQGLHQTQQPVQHVESSSISSDSKGSTFLSDRARLEKERLERQKRLRPEMAIEMETQRDIFEDGEERPAKRHHLSTSTSSRLNSNQKKPSNESFFWNGELRQTATMHAEPRKDGLPTFRLTDILGQVLTL